MKVASCPVRGCTSAPFICCAHKHTSMSLSRLFREQSVCLARGVLILFIVAVLALDFVESHQRERSSNSCVAKKSCIARTADIE